MAPVDGLTLLAVFAHPDDEAFGTGGTLARYAAEGCHVYLVTATRGEAGQISEPDLATAANLPLVRERELSCACEAYGIHAPLFLDYIDGQLTIVHQGQAVGKLVRVIRDFRPQVVITFGPDGIYGHYDHIAVHRWATIATEMASDPSCFPDQLAGSCQLHSVSKLYYRSLSQEHVSQMAQGGRAAVMMDGVPFRFVGRPEADFAAVLDVSDYVQQKLQGILCHATQVGKNWRSPEAVAETLRSDWFRSEHYLLARSEVGWPAEVERDLFRGLR